MDIIAFGLLASLLLGGAACAFCYFLFNKSERLTAENEALQGNLNAYRVRFAPVVDIEQELSRVAEVLATERANLSTTKNRLEELVREAETLRGLVELFKETTDLAEVGIYEPHFEFETPERYKSAIEAVREQQKQMVKDKQAVIGLVEWQVGGSHKEGEKMIKNAVNLTSRAFNGECEACIVNVTWANIHKMEARMTKARDDINKFNQVYQIVISDAYLQLKIQELRLNYEWRKKKQEDKEEQAEIRRQMREEEKAEKEAAAALAQAQKEEARYQTLLLDAQKEAQEAAAIAAQTHSQKDQERMDELQRNLADLNQKLLDANAKNARALSMAQQTKSGHVYVISNVGSFGEEVYKIGMTRRLDPQDRVDELGDASVPFCFDIHGMIHSTNAPEMENRLHKAFAHKRVNRVNLRKEFFKVSLEEIQREVSKIDPNATLVSTAAAEEFLQSRAIAIAESKTVGTAQLSD